MEFVSVVRGLGLGKKHRGQNDDLFVDRLNHRYTVAIIIVFTVVVTVSQYGGNPINCWVPGHFTGNYAKYAESICWVSSTYNIPLNEDLPNDEHARKIKLLKYYQWTPFILLFQALLFYIPRMIWRSMNDKSGLDLPNIINAVYKYEQDREKLLNYLTNHFDHYVTSIKAKDAGSSDDDSSKIAIELDYKKRQQQYIDEDSDLDQDDDLLDDVGPVRGISQEKRWDKFKRFVKTLFINKGKRYGNFLLVLFVFVKLLYTCNSVVQLFMLNHFLGNDYLCLGVEVLGKIWSGDDWAQLKRFPRVTMCDFRIREVGIVHRYSVQCVLSINLFNEKIFIFLWFWLCLVSFFNACDLVAWLYTLLMNGHQRYLYIKRRLTALSATPASLANANARFHFGSEITDLEDIENKRLFKKFVNNYLREDGVLALQLLSRNSHDLIVSEVIANLFTLYKSQQRRKRELQARIRQEQKQRKQQQHRNNESSDTYESGSKKISI